MNNTIGLIITGGRKDEMKELVAKRSVAAIPVGGKYRAIDFVLSNMVNSGINKVGIVTQYSFRSLMDHLGSGKEWDLDRRNDGLFMFPPYLGGDDGSGWYRGSADGMYNNLTFLNRSKEKYVIIATGNCIYKTNYDDFLEYHIDSGADMTIMYRDVSDLPHSDWKHFGILDLDENLRITDLKEKPLEADKPIASMGVYVLKRELLIKLLIESAAHGHYDFVKDIIIRKLDSLTINGYRYEGYWNSIATVNRYYQCNMDMIEPCVQEELFDQYGRIFTKVKDETPSKYNDEADVKHSIISDGCIIEGTVINSVLSRGVRVKRGAVIQNSIIMQDSVVGENASLNYCILDKEVLVTDNKHLKGEKEYPMIVGKHGVI